MTMTDAAAPRVAPGPASAVRRAKRRDTVVLLAALAAIAVAEAGYFAFVYVPNGRAREVQAWNGRLAALADDRREAIEAWVGERVSDARVVAAHPTVRALVGAPAGEAAMSGHLVPLLDEIVQAYRYRGAYVLDARGTVLIRSTAAGPLNDGYLGAVRVVLQSGAPTLDFFRFGGQAPVIGVIAPVRATGPVPGTKSRPSGVVVLTSDPAGWVYPMLLAEPVPTQSGEALLLRREGDRVLFLSPLRFLSAAPLTYSRPLDTPGFAAQELLEGRQGFSAYTDYRDVPVFAATRSVGGTNWGLVVKVNREEALTPFRRSAWATGTFLALITSTLALAGIGFWRSRRARYEAALAGSEARFAHLFEHANDAVVVSRTDGGIIAANARAEALYGYPRAELLALAIRDLRAPETLPQLGGQMRRVLDGHGLIFETVHVAKDGSPIPVEVSSRRIGWDGEPVLFSIIRDIRQRRAAEERIRFLNRLLRTISEVNQLVVRERDRGRLLAEACRILVEHGEFHMAWVGLAEPESGRVVPAASAGFDDGYLAAADVRFDDSPTGRGPTGTAIRERRPVVANDLESAESMAPWREAGRERGYRSSAAVPLEAAGVTVGALTAYADRAGVFTDEVVKLLVELAGDLSFALAAIEAERQRAGALEALVASEVRFRTLYERSPLGYQSLDAGGRIIDVNPAWVEALGYAAEDVVGRWFGDFLAPADVERFRTSFPRFVAAGEIHGIEFEMVRKDGERVVMTFDGRIGRDERGAFKRTHCILTDITERKRAEEATALLAAVVESSNDAVIAKRLDGTILSWNPGAERLYGYSPTEAVGQNISIVAPPELRGDIQEILDRVARGERVTHKETARVRKDGTRLDVSLTVSPIMDSAGAIIGASTIAQDITERKRAERALHEARDLLEVRVAERTAELQAANAELEAFSYSVSHDLRAPLRSIDGFSRIVEEEYGGSLDDEGRRLLRVVRDSAHKMAQLIDDLLAFSRSARHPLQPSRIDMGGLARSVCEEVTPPEVNARCEFTVGALPEAVGDAAMMRQVWVNLLSNAVKFTRPVTRPAIAVRGRVEGCEVIYTVSDNGVGFDMAYVGKLFGVFQRLHPAREFEGTGVGLALVQRIVHRHGGRVWADGVVGKGAAFSFALPAPGGAS